MIKYKVNDQELNALMFTAFAAKVWPGNYDIDKTQIALSKTRNITAYDGKLLVGCLRILSDGYFFGTITELLVLPEYQKQGIGSQLLQFAKENTPTTLYFGAQPGLETFYKKTDVRKACNLIQSKRRDRFNNKARRVHPSAPCRLLTFDTEPSVIFSAPTMWRNRHSTTFW